jgi:Fur family transcriptional regulator, stress-responsive regulator
MHTPLIDRLRRRGYRLTAQRRVVAEVLEGDNVHLTAEDVHDRATELLPEISRATVYATLQQFTELGEVRELALDGRAKRYDPNVEPAHHHLVCDTCGLVFDVAHGIDAPGLSGADRHGMEMQGAEIVYHGECSDCSDRADDDKMAP